MDDNVRCPGWIRASLLALMCMILPDVAAMRAGVLSASAGDKHHQWWMEYRRLQRSAAQVVRADVHKEPGAQGSTLSELPLVYPLLTGGPNNQLVQLLTTALVTRFGRAALISPEVRLHLTIHFALRTHD